MRKLFLFMLLVNTALLAYSQYFDTSSEDGHQRSADIGQLDLVQRDGAVVDPSPRQEAGLIGNGSVLSGADTGISPSLRRWNSAVGRCGVVTHITDAQMLIQLAQELNTLGITSIQTEKQSVTELFRVIIDPVESVVMAKASLLELKQSGFSDAWLISHGPLKHAVSLGVFNLRNAADIYANRLKTRGFEVNIKPMNEVDDYYELTFDIPQSLAEVNALVSQWQANKALSIYRTDCNE